jgi:rhodanese-related sulfurtransferase
MPTDLLRAEVQALRDRDALLVEVLPPREFGEYHILGAISIPLKEMNAHTTGQLDRNAPIIVYCDDCQ